MPIPKEYLKRISLQVALFHERPYIAIGEHAIHWFKGQRGPNSHGVFIGARQTLYAYISKTKCQQKVERGADNLGDLWKRVFVRSKRDVRLSLLPDSRASSRYTHSSPLRRL
jgi:hypothetical protein